MDSRLYQKSIILAIGCWLLTVGMQAQTNEQWRDSLNVINQKIATSPYSTDLHLRKAAINLELQQWEYAIDEYKTILRHDENNLTALFYRAYAYTHTRQYSLAKNDYNDILLKVPTHLEARLGLSYVYQLMGKRNDALDLLNIVVEQHPDSVAGYVARASLETDMQRYDTALYDWEEVIKREPDHTDYRLSYIDVLIRLGRNEVARRELDKLAGRGVNQGVLRDFYKKLKK
ncbi:MAG: tetratricopeptide repeat protein [Prevotella sp.]|nr:tetratricopeptide repeat protein [Prevotella sp.]